MSTNINPVRCPVCGDTFHGVHRCRPVVAPLPLVINLSNASLAQRLADTVSPPWLELYRDERLRRAALKLKKRRRLQ